MIRTIIFTLLMFVLLSNLIYASDSTRLIEPEQNFPKHYIGASVSSISAIGISYLFFENRKNPTDAFKLTLGIFPDLYNSQEIWIFAGAEFQTDLYKNDFSRLYWLLGAGYQSLYLSFGSAVG